MFSAASMLVLCVLAEIAAALPADGNATTSKSTSLLRRMKNEEEFSGKIGALFAPQDAKCRNHMKPGCDPIEKFSVDFWLNKESQKPQKPSTANCDLPCLFYTSHLSLAAERTANSVLWEQLKLQTKTGKSEYRTIWDFHDPQWYPDFSNLGNYPELKCIMEDHEPNDIPQKINGCTRYYFMAMSKAMALQCKDEVFVMSDSPDNAIPTDGIWWQVEFPTLIAPNRENKVTKISYLNVDANQRGDKRKNELTLTEQKQPPKLGIPVEYWPSENGGGSKQLKAEAAKNRPSTPPRRARQVDSVEVNNKTDDIIKEAENHPHALVDRSNEDETDELMVLGEDDDYPYALPIEVIYESWKDIAY